MAKETLAFAKRERELDHQYNFCVQDREIDL